MFDKIKKLLKQEKEGVETAVSQPATPSSSELRQQLNTYFNLDEIKAICLDLQIDYEQLSGDNKRAKVQELIIFCQRRHRLPELAAYLKDNRPEIVTNTPRPETPPVVKEPVKAVVEQRPLSPEEVKKIVPKLIKLMKQHLSLDEVQDICLELHIPYENLSGDSLHRKSMELVGFVRRRKRIPELIAVCQQNRPDVSWMGDEVSAANVDYDIAAIQELLQRVFADDEAMIGFCQIHFPDLMIEFGSGMSFQAKMNRLLEYCRRRQVYDTLLHELEAAYSDDFAQYAPYTEGS